MTPAARWSPPTHAGFRHVRRRHLRSVHAHPPDPGHHRGRPARRPGGAAAGRGPGAAGVAAPGGGAGAAGAAGRAGRAPGLLRPGGAAGLPHRHRAHPPGRLDGGADPGRPAGPPRRDHRPDRSEDGHQRAELRCAGVHGRFRGFDLADLAQPAGRPAGADRRGAWRSGVHRAGGGRWRARQALHAAAVRRAGGADRAPAWLAPGREARAGRRPADCRRPVRRGAVRLPQRPRADAPGPRPVFLPAQAAVDGRGGAVGNRAGAHRGHARPAARADQGHRADRDPAGGVRDGRDPACAAGAAGTTSSPT